MTPESARRWVDMTSGLGARGGASASSQKNYDWRQIDPVVVEDILNHAEEIAVAETGAGGEVTLLRLLKAYETVLQEHGIVPEEDTHYYRFLLKLSLDPDPNWWVKYEREKARLNQAGAGLTARTPRMTPHHGGDGFDSDYYDVRERVLAETKRSNRQVHYHPGTGGGGYYPEYGEDPAESGYADFKLLAASFRVWVRHAAALRALRIAREAAVENYMISVSFWECQTLKRCLSRWRGRRNVFQLHALRFWYGSNLKMRFLWWREISKFNRVGAQSKAIDAHRKAAMKKAFKGWSIEAAREAALSKCGGSVEAQTLHRIKLMSYVKWRSAFHERIRRREVLERCARRIMQRSLSGAYQAWVHFTLVRLEQKATYERVLEIPKRRHMRIGWFSWRNAFLDRERMRRACRLILNSQIARALRTWKNVVDELVDMRRKCERVIARLQMRAAAGAFARWCEMVDEIQEQRGVLEKAVRTMITQRGLRSAWAKWVEYAEQEIEFREKTGKIIKHFMNRTMAAAWNRWIEFAEHCQLVRMAAKYFVNGTLMRAFQKWRGSPPFPVSSFVFVTYHGLRVRFRRFRQIDDAISRHRRDLLCYFIASSCVSSLAASRRSRLHPEHPRHHLHLPPHRPRALSLSPSPSLSLSLSTQTAS